MDNQTKNAIRELVQYVFEDESEDFQCNPSPNHIFNDILRIKEWLDPDESDENEFHYAIFQVVDYLACDIEQIESEPCMADLSEAIKTLSLWLEKSDSR